MRKAIWIAAAVLLIVAAISVWFAFQRPDFVAGLVAAAASALFTALWPSFKKFFRPATGQKLEDFHDNVDRAKDFGLPGQRKRER